MYLQGKQQVHLVHQYSNDLLDICKQLLYLSMDSNTQLGRTNMKLAFLMVNISQMDIELINLLLQHNNNPFHMASFKLDVLHNNIQQGNLRFLLWLPFYDINHLLNNLYNQYWQFVELMDYKYQ
jgi:hypothetical protein